MIRVLAITLIVVVIGLASTTAYAASCVPSIGTLVQVGVTEAPIAIVERFSLADLDAMSAQAGQARNHPALGFYIGSVGFVLRRATMLSERMTREGALACPRLEVEAELVAVERAIAIASDLKNTECLRRAALEHYNRHAGAASAALHQLAAGLQNRLGPRIDQYLMGRSSSVPARGERLHAYIESLMDEAVAAFTSSLREVQSAVDTPAEVRMFVASCQDT